MSLHSFPLPQEKENCIILSRHEMHLLIHKSSVKLSLYLVPSLSQNIYFWGRALQIWTKSDN